MKTENMNQVESLNQSVNPSEEKNEKYGKAREAAVGTMGGVVGGAAGAAIGSVIAQEAGAKEPVEEPVNPVVDPDPVPVKPEPARHQPERPVTPEEPEKPEEPVKPDEPVKPEGPDTPDEPVTPEGPDTPDEPVTPEGPEVQVLGYEAIQTEDGGTMQLAAVSVNGEVVQLAEVTGDDIVDFAGMDVNQDGKISENEILDVSNEGISMQALHNAYQETQSTAQNTDIGEPDYINDGNVDDYMA